MSQAEFSDETGTVRLKGTLKGGGVANAIPQGGPLTAPLKTGFNSIGGDNFPQSAYVRLEPAPNATDGGGGFLQGGFDSTLTKLGAAIECEGATAAAHGHLTVLTDGGTGQIGQALVRKSATAGAIGFGGVVVSTIPPVAPPDGFLPFYVDTTPVTGGLYVWDVFGAAWVKVSAIP